MPAVQDADIFISMLRDDDASRTVWLDEHSGVAFGLKESAIAIECRTLNSAFCQNLAEYVIAQGSHFLIQSSA